VPRLGIIALFALATGVSACAYYDDYPARPTTELARGN
jgi:hypothetical protein